LAWPADLKGKLSAGFPAARLPVDDYVAGMRRRMRNDKRTPFDFECRAFDRHASTTACQPPFKCQPRCQPEHANHRYETESTLHRTGSSANESRTTRRARESREIAAVCVIFASSRAPERRRTTLVEADLINSSPRRGEPVPFAPPEIGVPSFHCSIAPEESANDRERWPCQCAGGGNPQTQIRARELESIAC